MVGIVKPDYKLYRCNNVLRRKGKKFVVPD